MHDNDLNQLAPQADLVTNSVEVRLPKPMRAEMEKEFAADFSDVKIYEGHAATLRGAKSFADGNTVHFAPGQFDPFSSSGKELIGHELAHVVQQRSGGVLPPGQS